MFMVLKKRTVIVVILILALCVAGALSKRYSDKTSSAADSSSVQYEPVGQSEMVSAKGNANDNYVEALERRNSDREKAITLLNDIVNNTAAAPDARQQASGKISAIADMMLKESAAEEQLRAKGYDKSIVYISEKEINVSVYKDVLSESDIAKIRDIIVSQTDNNNIKIVAVR